MKKFLMLGALLVVTVTSFGASQILDDPAAGAGVGTGTNYSGGVSLDLNAQGTIIDADKDPVLVVEPDLPGTGVDALEFDFKTVTLDMKPVLTAGFTARIEVEGTPKELAKDAIKASLSAGGVAADATNGNIEISLKDRTSVGTSAGETIGKIMYSLNFEEVKGTATSANGYSHFDGEVTATLTPTKAGSFIDTTGKVDVTVSAYDPSASLD